MEVFEGQPFSIDETDRRFLATKLGGLMESRGGKWAVTRCVGHVRLPSGQIMRIRSPKATGASLLAWLAYADPTLRALKMLGRIPRTTAEGDLAVVVARLFLLELLHAAARYGLTRRYRCVHVLTSTVRGKIDFSGLARAGGDFSKIPCIVWERLSETPLNQFLAAVVERLERDGVLKAACASEISQAAAVLSGVRPAISHALFEGRSPLPRGEQGFETACALGRLILRSTALSEGGDLGGFAFLVNLESLFERTVEKAFRESGVPMVAQAPIRYDRFVSEGEEHSPASTPMAIDVFFPDTGGGPLVVDAKYKTLVSAANIQQMVAYCFHTGARNAVLVFPAGHLTDRRSYRFPGGGHRAGDQVRIDLAELATDALDVQGWREAAKELVSAILHRSDERTGHG